MPMKKKKSKLKPCPFCGKDVVEFLDNIFIEHKIVICKTCRASGPRRANTGAAANAWNRRRDAAKIKREVNPK